MHLRSRCFLDQRLVFLLCSCFGGGTLAQSLLVQHVMRNTDPESFEVRAGTALGIRLSPEKSVDPEQFKRGPAGVIVLWDHYFKGRRSGRFCGAGLRHGCSCTDLAGWLPSEGAVETVTSRPPWNKLVPDLTVEPDVGCEPGRIPSPSGC